MQALMLRDERQESEVIPQRIRRLLRERHAMHVGELGLRLGLSREALNVCLGSLLAAGEIERLRPMAYEAEDPVARREGLCRAGAQPPRGQRERASRPGRHDVRLRLTHF